MSLVALSPQVRNDGNSLLRFSGTPRRAVLWSVQSGPGSVAGLSNATDDTGTAYALYDPAGGTPGSQAVVRVTYGT